MVPSGEDGVGLHGGTCSSTWCQVGRMELDFMGEHALVHGAK